MPAHDSLYILRHVLTAPRLMYLLRTAPCTSSPELPLYDAILRDSLSATLNVELNDKRWNQASLPVWWGGLRVRRLSCWHRLPIWLQLQALPNVHQPSFQHDCVTPRTAESTPPCLLGQSRQRVQPTPSIMPVPPTSSSQSAWDDMCCKVQADSLLDAAVDPVGRARLLSARSPDSGDWLSWSRTSKSNQCNKILQLLNQITVWLLLTTTGQS